MPLRRPASLILPLLAFCCAALTALGQSTSRQLDGDGSIKIEGELKQWHKVTLTLSGPYAHERDTEPNPFTDRRLTIVFTHESGSPAYRVPGYFSADGRAAESGAEAGTVWRAHLSPDKAGRWTYRVEFTQGKHAALDGGGAPLAPFNGKSGSFTIARTDKTGRDFRALGRLGTTGGRYLRFAGTGDYFLKAGPDAPETLLAYHDFDGTERGRKQPAKPGAIEPNQALKTWAPHLADWRAGDPTWRGDKGKGLIGALNYLAGKGLNAFSFLTYNAGGDGDNIWPFVARTAKTHYDCSKLDQWGIVFDHATHLGLFLHFKLQENESDDNRKGQQRTPAEIPESLDGGALGPERKLYVRELVARFGHALALNWNLGEENTQSPEEQRAMAQFIADTDPYHHLIVVHTFPNDQDKVYPALIGDQSVLSGASLQNNWNVAHARTLHWIDACAKAGKTWVICQDEQGPADMGVPPDPGYKGSDGKALSNNRSYDLHDIRKATLWGTLLAGGAGVEYYFGYKLPENDLVCEEFRAREKSWDYCRIALQFFRENKIPFWKMQNADALVGNPKRDNSRYCFAKPGELYLVYLSEGGAADLDLGGASGTFSVAWFNPRTGGALQKADDLHGGATAKLTAPSSNFTDDWLAVVRKK
ncbi:MAG: DUF5060 domain-containing protein [Verrucomicrobiota bacterium]